jgi:hypothetical protein
MEESQFPEQNDDSDGRTVHETMTIDQDTYASAVHRPAHGNRTAPPTGLETAYRGSLWSPYRGSLWSRSACFREQPIIFCFCHSWDRSCRPMGTLNHRPAASSILCAARHGKMHPQFSINQLHGGLRERSISGQHFVPDIAPSTI